jgi:hypothetical protein
MVRSESIGELISALSAAQIEFDPVLKDSSNPAYKSKYADMASVIRATQPSLSKNGLAVVQFPISSVAEQQAGIETILAHKSGQFIESTYMLPALMHGNRFDAQSCGSAFTYARRYAYQAAVGVAGEDDDANLASGVGSKQAAQEVAQRKLAEHEAKSKQDTEYNVILTPVGDTLVALSGNGLAVVRSNMTADDRAFFQIRTVNGAFCMKASLAFNFQDFCKKHDVGFILMGNAPTNGVTKAVIPPLSIDPIIDSAEIIKGKKGSFLSVMWGGKKLSCFEHVGKESMKPLWDLILANKGKPADFLIKQNDKFFNIEGIKRLNGHDYEADQKALYEGTLEPEQEYLEPSTESY